MIFSSPYYRSPLLDLQGKPPGPIESFVLDVVRPRKRMTFFPWPKPCESWLAMRAYHWDGSLKCLSEHMKKENPDQYFKGLLIGELSAGTDIMLSYVRATRTAHMSNQLYELMKLEQKKARARFD